MLSTGVEARGFSQYQTRINPPAAWVETVCLVDLLATCADILGERLPDDAGEDSVSNLALWLGHRLDGPLREATVHHSIDGSFSIRQGRWKLEMCPGSGGWSHPRPGKECEGLPPIQLYDLETDIGERTNVADRHPQVVERLKALLSACVRNGRSTPGRFVPRRYGPRRAPCPSRGPSGLRTVGQPQGP